MTCTKELNTVYNLPHRLPEAHLTNIPILSASSSSVLTSAAAASSSSTPVSSSVPPKNEETIAIGGRSSKLAVIQSESVKSLIQSSSTIPYNCKIISKKTLGDHIQFKPLYTFGGKSLWTKELEDLLLCETDNEQHCLDMIVHSLKDMPTNLPDPFQLGCIVERIDPTDCLVFPRGSHYKTIDDLPRDAVIGTSSIRRSAQLKKWFPHWKFMDIRGNIQTRLAKLDNEGTFDAIVLASAGLIRLNLENRISIRLTQMYHAIGQGALGVEIRQDDQRIMQILQKIEHIESTICCIAERELLRTMEGGCSVPIGVKSLYNELTRELQLKAMVIDCDGDECIEDSMTMIINDIHKDSTKCGHDLAIRMIENGADKILQSINEAKMIM